MNIETVNEKVRACKFVGHENIVEVVEGDVIVPDIKPDILSLINVDGNVFITKKEVQNGKVRIDGCIEAFALYVADDEKTSIKGINALLNFTETIDMPDAKEGMLAIVRYKLIGMEHKVLNSRKISVKCSIEMDIKIIGDEEIEITKDITEPGNIQYIKESICISELAGATCQNVEIKENVMLNEGKPAISEILKTKLSVVNCSYKISYNKILVKADLRINIVYVADNDSMSIEAFETMVPIAGFIDMNGVSDKNLISIDTSLKNSYIKPIYQDLKANGVSVEAQVEVCARAYGEKNMEVLSDLYNPIYEMSIEDKKIIFKQNIDAKYEDLDLSQTITIPELANASLLNLNAIPSVNEMRRNGSKLTIEGNVNLEVLYYDREKKKIEIKKIELPFQKILDSNCDDTNIILSNVEYSLKDNGQLELKIIIRFVCDDVKNLKLNLITKIEQTNNKHTSTASLIIYYVQPGDSLWNIAKKFKTTVELIKSSNNLSDDTIYPGQQLIIPKVVEKVSVNPLM